MSHRSFVDEILLQAQRRCAKTMEPSKPIPTSKDKPKPKVVPLEDQRKEWMEKREESLKKKAKESANELSTFLSLRRKYPDFYSTEDRWRNRYNISKSVNHLCTDFQKKRSCGCCPDPAIYIMPYVETEHGRIYSDPYQFCVGEGQSYSRIRIDDGWDTKMREAGIPEKVIEKARQSLIDELEEYKQSLMDDADGINTDI